MKYNTLYAGDMIPQNALLQLTQATQKCLDEGWKPQGGICMASHLTGAIMVSQALIKEDTDDTES